MTLYVCELSCFYLRLEYSLNLVEEKTPGFKKGNREKRIIIEKLRSVIGSLYFVVFDELILLYLISIFQNT